MVIDCNILLVIFTGWLVIVIVSWAIENNLVYLRPILVSPVILIVSWVIENTLVYLRTVLVELMTMIIFWAIENNLVNF